MESFIASRLANDSLGSSIGSPVSRFLQTTELSNSIRPNMVSGEFAARLSIDVLRLRLTAARFSPAIDPETSMSARNDRPPVEMVSVSVSVSSGGSFSTKSVSSPATTISPSITFRVPQNGQTKCLPTFSSSTI